MAEASSPSGKFVLHEYMGNDLKAAVDFYTGVVGWSAKDAGMGFDFAYQILSTGSTMVAGMMDVPKEAKAMGAKPSWMGYIWVEDVDKALPKLTAAGGKVCKAPADIPGVGRFAVVADPDGAAFMLFKDAGGNPPPPPPGTPGLIGWRELHAGDGAAPSRSIRASSAGRRARPRHGGDGRLPRFRRRRRSAGRYLHQDAANALAVLLYYFNVDAIDSAVEHVKAHGGKVVNGPMETPNGRWILQGLDPQGAMFALVAPKR